MVVHSRLVVRAVGAAFALLTVLSTGCSNLPASLGLPTLGSSSPATAPLPSTHPGMGALVYSGGVAFRVWAPFATSVSVEGDFNSWSQTANPLAAEGNGNWSADLPGAIAGQTYKWVINGAAGLIEKADPRALEQVNSAAASVIYDPNAFSWRTPNFTAPALNDQVIYEMHLGTFNRSNPSAVAGWSLAAARLDYLKALGVDMIEVMPVGEFSGDLSWGYNGSYPFAPDHTYGSPDDAKAFIDAAHARGMGVIIDVVHNHYGPQDLSMWCFDGQCLGIGNGGAYFYTDARRETGWGPRPDFGRPQVRDYVVDNAQMWLGNFRADGLRWDSTLNIRTAAGQDNPDGWGLLMRANDMANAFGAGKTMIAEDLQGNAWITKPTSVGGAGFESQWDAGFFHPVDDNLINSSDAGRSMPAIAGAIGNNYNGVATGRVVYTESHDEVANGKERIPEMIWPGNAGSYYSRKRSTLGAVMVMTSPGIPMIFMGQEFLENGYFADTHPLDWTKTTTYSGILQLYTDLIHLRRNTAGTTAGLKGNNVNVFHVNDTAKVIAYHRWDQGGPGDDVVTVANLSNTAFPSYNIGFPRGGTWHTRFNSDSVGYSPDYGNTPSGDVTALAGGQDGLGFHGTVTLAPYSAIILSQ